MSTFSPEVFPRLRGLGTASGCRLLGVLETWIYQSRSLWIWREKRQKNGMDKFMIFCLRNIGLSSEGPDRSTWTKEWTQQRAKLKVLVFKLWIWVVQLSFDVFIEGSLNSKLPTIWTVEKQSRVVKSAERRCNSAKVRRKKIHPRQMLEKSPNAVFFQWFVCRVSRKVGLLKRRVRR